MRQEPEISGYRYDSADLNESHGYLLPAVERILASSGPAGMRIFELGCGNGSVANYLSAKGYSVTGIDPSEDGIRMARLAYPALDVRLGTAYDDLVSQYGRFPVVLSLEVIEHLFFPRRFAATIRDLLEPGGTAIISTPYHGYWKNLAMALAGRMDAHFTALWDHGHIKFWSFETLAKLLEETGFHDVSFVRVGRVPPLAKSMIAVVKK
jgi:2-polyprenyl-3-methyl-5-hydroxy-6-metoxy-1,4-benzoquinol methylase